jgi:carbon monoxide dehydrogenase subunit G
MNNASHIAGSHEISCADFSVFANVESAPSGVDFAMMGKIDLRAGGPLSDGSIRLSADGWVNANVGECSLNLVSSGILADAGNLGNITLRAGTVPAVQRVELEGNEGSIVLQNGQLPVSPKIEVKADSIELSVGPNKIVIDSTGVSISGLKVTVEATTDASVSACNVNISALATATVNGSSSAEFSSTGITTVKGAMVMLN